MFLLKVKHQSIGGKIDVASMIICTNCKDTFFYGRQKKKKSCCSFIHSI